MPRQTETTACEVAWHVSGRNIALCNLDMDWARKQMPTASSDEVRLCSMHKARYECTGIERDLRIKSYKWLKLRHFTRMDGSPLLPYGELPE